MIKKNLFAGLLVFSSIYSWAGIVDTNYARQAAQNFYVHETHRQVANLTLAYTCLDNNTQGVTSAAGTPVYYVFSVNGSNGFVIISAESMVAPILAYSATDAFSIGNIAAANAKWLEGYREKILNVRYNSTLTPATVTNKWTAYYNNSFPASASRSVHTVAPLVTTNWDQAPYYNDLCPYDSTAHAFTITGCVATAMAQILKYWDFPAKGTGSNSYSSSYGTLSADFDTTVYHWSNMPNVLNVPNNAVATLMYDCGVAVNMDYGTTASGAFVLSADGWGGAPCAQTAFVNNFGYDGNMIQGLQRGGYTDSDWINTIKAELDTSRPVQYAGYGAAGGHTWVCDGYDENDFFHMNWGWSGMGNGYYSIDNLSPPGGDSFDGDEEVLIGIQPANFGITVIPANLSLNSSVNLSQSPYVMKTPLSITVSVANNDSVNFSGGLAAGLYSSQGVLISYLQELPNVQIGAGHDTSITFHTDSIVAIPGTYSIGIVYKTHGLSYTLVPQASYINPINFNLVIPHNYLELDSNTVVTSGYIHPSSAIQIIADVKVDSSSYFSGTIGAELFDLNGNLVGIIDSTTYAGTVIFPGVKTQLIFSNNTGLNIPTGSYYLAIYTLDDANNDVWELAGNDYFANPIMVGVTSELLPDVYEVNNTAATAYVFYPAFIAGNVAEVSTPGANIHIATDVDYYTLSLPQGTYTMSAQVYDSQHPDGVQTYSDDVEFSYSVDGGTAWSATYDITMPSPITYTGGPLTFLVTSYSPGTTGTYLLDVKLTDDATGISTVTSAQFSVSPNPVHDMVTINPGDISGNAELDIYDMIGKRVFTKQMELQQGQQLSESLSFLDNGIYVARLRSSDATRESKFVISH